MSETAAGNCRISPKWFALRQKCLLLTSLMGSFAHESSCFQLLLNISYRSFSFDFLRFESHLLCLKELGLRYQGRCLKYLLFARFRIRNILCPLPSCLSLNDNCCLVLGNSLRIPCFLQNSLILIFQSEFLLLVQNYLSFRLNSFFIRFFF